ncbi:MAG: tetratricopeptide repeat protein, partial [Alphaproteobacteria bacterium]|nr:tetratricopeptide repeat protein [Alphaproteobacteria bacterium]
MFVKRLSLFLCVLSFFSFNQSEAVLDEKYFKQKKYAFSEPVLDEKKAFSAIAMKGVSITNDEAQEVFLAMWEEALEGNEKVQEILFCLFSRSVFFDVAKDRVRLLAADKTKYSLDILIDIGVAQEKSWAFYQKALTEKNKEKKFTLLNQAMNNPNMESDLLKKINQERDSLISEFVLPIPNGKNKYEIIKFVTHYKKYKDMVSLYHFYENNKKSNKILAEECFKAANELGCFSACIDQSNQSFFKNEFENMYKWSLKPAKLGDPHSMHNVGCFLASNNQVEEGLMWFLKASEAGFVNSMYLAADVLSQFFDGPISQIKTFNLMKTAAQLGHMKAIGKYVQMLKDGFAGHEPNLEEAADLFLKVIKSDDAEQNDKAEAMYYYGLLLKEGLSGQKSNKKVGNEWILKAAKGGCAAAMNHYGGFLMGWVDDNVEKNVEAAYRWFLKAANAGDHISMCVVGEILWFGDKGVKQNRKAAKEWLRQASSAGYLDAAIFLSRDLMIETFEEDVSVEDKEKLFKEIAKLLSVANDFNYFSGLFDSKINASLEKKLNTDLLLVESEVSQQNKEVEIAVEPQVGLKSKHIVSLDQLLKNEKIIYNKTIQEELIRCSLPLNLKDKVIAIVNLAQLYFYGYVDGKRNIKKAFELLLPIAKNNHVEAMNCIGRLFLQETEEQKPNYKKAFKWFKRAAENGHVDSMVMLGDLIFYSCDFFENNQNLSDALFWFQKANSLGSKDAAAYLEMCKNASKESAELEITDEEISHFIEVNDVSNSNKNLHPLIMPNKVEDNGISLDKDGGIEAFESDDSVIHVVLD